MSFRSQGIEPRAGFTGDGFVVRPFAPAADAARDYEAVMSSREFLYHWEQEPPWPAEDFTVEENLADLERMDDEHQQGSRYTYTVVTLDETQVLGCVYCFPNDDRMFGSADVTSHDGTDFGSIDLVFAFWVRVSTWGDGFERMLLEAVLGWIRDDWSISAPVVLTNDALDHQVATIESLGLTHRFQYKRGRDLYTNLVYG